MSTKISELRVGDIVAITNPRCATNGRAPYTLDWKVTNITATGQVSLQQTKEGFTMIKRRFDKYGQEMLNNHTFNKPLLEPDHLKAVREVHLWQLLDDVRKALDALRKELNTGVVPATHAEHCALSESIAKLHQNYLSAVWQAHLEGALK